MNNIKLFFARYIISIIRFTDGGFFRSIRRRALKVLLRKMGSNVFVWPATYIDDPSNLEIGKNVSIHQFCLISCFGGVKIGDDVSIAAGTKIFSSTHPYDNSRVKIRDGKLLKNPVEIGNDVWIGANVLILPGVKIDSGVIVGAGSVVTDYLEKNGIYAGVPAKLIKRRF